MNPIWHGLLLALQSAAWFFLIGAAALGVWHATRLAARHGWLR